MPFVNALQCLALVKLIIKATVTVATFVMINIIYVIYVECTHCSYSGRLNFGKLIHKKYLQNLMFIL